MTKPTLSVTDAVQRPGKEPAELEAEIRRLTFYDRLTGLANRHLFHDRIEQAGAVSARNGNYCSMLLLDLDRFKGINDLRGYRVGDQLLQIVAARLRNAVRACDTVARRGGDEFAVLFLNLSDNADRAVARSGRLAEQIRRTINEPIFGHEYGLDRDFHLSAGIGVVLFRGREESSADLLRYVDTAMRHAKGAGLNNVRFFDPAMQITLEENAALIHDLRLALQRDELILHYQPQTAADGRIVGAEALVRWQHPQQGMVAPDRFIPLAEENGLIIPIGRRILQLACAAAADWRRRIGTDWQLAVNVSARQFHQATFVDEVREVLAATGLEPGRLKLELTESLVLADLDDTVTKMRALRDDGIGFAMDDFGTGHSSLAKLKHLPLDQLKIDRSFVRDLETNPQDTAIIRAIIAMGRALGLEIVAEGVETAGQSDFLASHGCQVFQGYLFSRPLPAADFERLLQAGCRCLQDALEESAVCDTTDERLPISEEPSDAGIHP